MRPITVITTAAAILSAALMFPALAQDYPSKPLRFVVASTPGGILDVLARMVSFEMRKTWSQPIVVENISGATGTIGMNAVAKAAPDGYTIGISIISYAINAAVRGAALPYDFLNDFTPITQLTSNSYVMAVHVKTPAVTVAEFVALARAKPNALSYGSAGNGSLGHLAAELLAMQANLSIVHVPYRSAAQLVLDLAGGTLHMGVLSPASLLPSVNQNKVRLLAVTTATRIPSLPNVPTFKESGFPEFEIMGWYGVVGPAGLAHEIVDKLQREMARSLRTPENQKRLANEELTAVGSTPAEFAVLIKSELNKWGGLAKARRITLD
jgi:tripartite-type tricarboxylate transporter receptor subunit TctC